MAAIPGGVPIAGFISPTDSSDTYPVIDPLYGIDGYRSVSDHTIRNAIPDARRRFGMMVFTQNDSKNWTLDAGPWAGTDADWTEFTGGGGGSPGGPTDSVQVNDGAGGFTGDANFTFDGTDIFVGGELYVDPAGDIYNDGEFSQWGVSDFNAAATFNDSVTVNDDVTVNGDATVTDTFIAPSRQFNTAPAGNAYHGDVQTGTLGETVAIGEMVYFKSSDSKWWKTDADDVTKSGPVEIRCCVEAGNADAVVKLLSGGYVASGLFPTSPVGAPCCLSETAGRIVTSVTTTEDFVKRIVGYVLDSSGRIYFNPDDTYLIFRDGGNIKSINGVLAPTAADLQGLGLDVDAAGFRGVPPQNQSANYTIVAADAGKSINHLSGAGAGDTFTIPANASVAFEDGTLLHFANMDANAVSIAITSDTLYLAGTGTTGTRSLAQYGVATARKLTSTTWIISGTGLT